MSLFFQSGGILTTVQDLGRIGFRRFGINPNGAADRKATRLINILLGNEESEAVLEMMFPAPRILFEKSAIIALGGADFAAKIGEKNLETWRPYFVEKGEVLSFHQKKFGNFSYLAIKGGFLGEEFLGSASTNLRAKIGGLQGNAVRKGDRILFKTNGEPQKQEFNFRLADSIIPPYQNLPEIRVIEGAEFHALNPLSELNFLKNTYRIKSDSDRMGYRLTGAPLYLYDRREIVSSGVKFGTIQLLPDGQLIILMADAQTTGGYPRLAHIISEDLPIIAQLGANNELKFGFVTIEEAEESAIGFERKLNLLKIGIDEKMREKTTL